MCGRYTLTSADPAGLQARFRVDEEPPLAPRYNIAPGQQVLTVGLREGSRRAEQARWGLVPHWAKSERAQRPMINARAETVAERPAYRDAFHRWRCLVPADGFYEWLETATGKQPQWVSLADRGLFAFAGLRSAWKRPGGDWLITCAIITTAPNELLAPIHDRMPAILPRDGEEAWLAPSTPPAELAELMRPYPSVAMAVTPVSRAVNDVANDGPECIEPVASEPAQLGFGQ